MKTDAEIFRDALVKLLPAAEYGEGVASQIRLKGYSSMTVALREARNVLRLGQPKSEKPRG